MCASPRRNGRGEKVPRAKRTCYCAGQKSVSAADRVEPRGASALPPDHHHLAS
jgi:hypothetical protein